MKHLTDKQLTDFVVVSALFGGVLSTVDCIAHHDGLKSFAIGGLWAGIVGVVAYLIAYYAS